MPAIVSEFVEVCIFSFRGAAPEYLVLRRSPAETLYPGVWQFVTGAPEGNETAAEAARRELAEETSLTPIDIWTVPHVNVFYDPRNDSIQVTPVFAARVDPGTEPVLSPEHSEYRWCDYPSALTRLAWPGQREALGAVHEHIVGGGEVAGLSRLLIP